ncbi:MFS transporter [Corynebacterium terpenotabidum]|uniref:Major facilitator superfamily permease n=1 Tax=Corynebacterium terpenotabidum Y-11 TaxID=1200352 RepID=S4XDS5_9CORY|nr:MFS transporter [Corynebacterium terpenotabidum]AGP29745.1 major facilitator superfamily permease [Corynebacterium terpenotabidum Y-11]
MTATVTSPPATGRSLAAAAYIFAVVMMGTTLPTPLYPTMSGAFGFGSAATTVLFAVYAVGVVAGLVIFGRLSDTLGRRPVLAVALVLSLVSAVMFLAAGLPTDGSGVDATGGSTAGLVLMYVGRVLSGFAAGIFTGTGTVTVMENAPAGRATLAAAVATAANIGGLGLGVLVAGCVAELADNPLTWPFITHAVMLAVAALLLPGVRDGVVRPARTERTRCGGWLPRPQVPGVPAPVRGLFVASVPAVVAGYTVCGVFSSLAPNFMSRELGISSPATVAVVTAALFLASAVAQIVLRGWPDRVLMVLGLVLLVVCALVVILALAVDSLALLLVASVCGGVGQGLTFMTGMRAMTSRVPAAERTAVTTSYFIVGYLALAVPAMLAGFLTVPMGLVGSTTVFSVITVVLSMVGLGFVRRF